MEESDGEYDIVHSGYIERHIEMILFANPKSGSNKAQAYLDLQDKKFTIKVKEGDIKVNIFNLQEEQGRVEGCAKARELISLQMNVRIIVAGGDGSLIWAIQSCIEQNLEISCIEFGILPFGSGNDLAGTLGWGRDPPSDLFEAYAREWWIAMPRSFDFWEIKAEVHELGGFGRVSKSRNSVNKNILKFGEENQLVIHRLMSNYFSVGLDARIGLGFDKHRTTKKCCNRFFYAWEGFKKMCCCVKTATVPELISRIIKQENTVIVDNTTDDAMAEDTSVILALNIRTYGGGEHYVWDKARSLPHKQWEKQSPSDNKIELLTFEGKMSLGLEQIKCTQGQARKLDQSEGPFRIEFNETSAKAYMQIDGEYYYLEKPKQISLKLWDKSPEIKVLFRSKN